MKEKEIICKIYEYEIFEELDQADQQLINESKEAALRAYSPYSNFSVGAAVLLDNGIIVQGNNQENIAYPSGLCAERVAIFYANSRYPSAAVKAIAVCSYTNNEFTFDPITPCGACRQVLVETEERYTGDMKVLLYGTSKTNMIKSTRYLMPLSFEKKMLGK